VVVGAGAVAVAGATTAVTDAPAVIPGARAVAVAVDLTAVTAAGGRLTSSTSAKSVVPESRCVENSMMRPGSVFTQLGVAVFVVR
jgi:hypothetical protein